MKRLVRMILAALVILSLGVVFAADKPQSNTEAQPDTQMQRPMMKDKGMMGQGVMGQGMMGQGMSGSMMDKKIIATQDGGIVIWMGNKLIKYDKELKLVKEVDLKSDMMGMKKGMMEKHPEMGCAGEEFKAVYPYHHKSGAIQAEEEVDPHAIDPYHHAPKN